MTAAARRPRHATTLASIGIYLLGTWSFGFIWFGGPFPHQGPLNPLAAILWFAALIAISYRLPPGKHRYAAVALLLIPPLATWLLTRPSHHRDWEPSFEKIAFAEISGNTVTIHNHRTFDYAPDTTPLPTWSTRTFDLQNLQGIDFFMARWSSPLAGHPIFSFDFGEQGHCAFTIEAKLEKGESYSLPAGLFRRYELAYISCDESDAIRLRTHFRHGEQVHLYRTIATPAQARTRFLEFISSMNDVRENPRFYNVISSNCTTAIRSQMSGGFPWDWRVIINGKLDELLYERHMLETTGLSFPELQKASLINPKATTHPQKENFSQHIRKGTPGF